MVGDSDRDTTIAITEYSSDSELSWLTKLYEQLHKVVVEVLIHCYTRNFEGQLASYTEAMRSLK